MKLEGLSEKQVAERVRQGRVNQAPGRGSDSVGRIVLTNTLTIFNLVNLILALMIISVGAYKNLLFILIAIFNTLISIVNGIRAKRTIDKMRLVAEQKPTAIRGGKARQIAQTEIVEGDLLVMGLGDQVIVDARIEEGQVEVNESFITGESNNVVKRVGEALISGSFIVSGTCKATATAVGAESQLSRIESSARTIKTADSKLFRVINNIVKYISFALIPIGALLLWARFNVPDTTAEVAVTSTVAGLISMIPEGLVLLTSSVLALATIRLARRQVLVQDLYSVETLARVDTICLDKTGTLTTGKMKVVDLLTVKGDELVAMKDVLHPGSRAEKSLVNALMAILRASETDNATSGALKAKLLRRGKNKPVEGVIEVIPFSSERKYSGVVTRDGTYLMGALEFLTDKREYLALEHLVGGNHRVIAVMKDGELLGFVTLEDELRKDASEIIEYFYDNEVEVKIISGDNLQTVEEIASAVGVREISGVDLSVLTGEINYDKLVREYNIFTRVKPAQKKSLVLALKKAGRTVAMTGDGVNDILAMKEADCSIAIGEGSDAARRSAKLVLLDNDFAGVPKVISEGRQSINNLERSATLFLSKNTYAAILAVLFILIPVEYPYAPLEMSLLNIACIGLPGVILALEPNTARIKNRFAKNILQFSVPTGVTVAVTMLVFAVLAEGMGYSRAELITTSAIVTFAIDFLLIFSIARPLNWLRGGLLIVSMAIVTLAILIPLTREFLDFTLLSVDKLVIAGALIVGAYVVFLGVRMLMKRLTPKILRNPRLQI